MARKRIYRPEHSEPGAFRLNFILLPYGEHYKTNEFLEARRGDTLRIYGGQDYRIDSVYHITDGQMCDMLCRMRYGIPWSSVLDRWTVYARAQGYGRDALRKNECIMVVYGAVFAQERTDEEK